MPWKDVELIHLLGDVAVFVAAGAATLFCLLYHLTAPWRRSTKIGRLFTLGGSIVMLSQC